MQSYTLWSQTWTVPVYGIDSGDWVPLISGLYVTKLDGQYIRTPNLLVLIAIGP